MKITANARRHHTGKTHTLYEGPCSSLYREGDFLLWGITDVIQASLNGTFTFKITLSLDELDAIRAREIEELRAKIARLEKKLGAL